MTYARDGRAPSSASERASGQRVLVVDDERDLLNIYSHALRSAGYEPVVCPSGAEGLSALAAGGISAVVLDLCLTDMDAFEFMARRPEGARAVPVVVVTGAGDEAVVVRLMKAGVRDYFTKSVDTVNAIPIAVRHMIHESDLALRASNAEMRYRALFESTSDAIFIQPAGGTIVDVNGAACTLSGLSVSELQGRSLTDILVAGEGAPEWGEEKIAALQQLERLTVSAELLGAGGKRVPVDLVLSYREVDGEGLYFASARDRTEDIRQAEALAMARSEWDRTFDAITNPLVITDPQLRVVRANQAMQMALGRELADIAGESIRDILLVGAPTPLREGGAALPATPMSWEAEVSALGGQFEMTAFPRLGSGAKVRSVLFYCKDVTRERQMRERMLQSEKLLSLGQLVSGVAHELNNPLAAIQGLSELLIEDLRDTQTAELEDAEGILEQAQRASGIVRNLQQFAKRSHQSGEAYDINRAVQAAVALLRYRFASKEIEVVQELTDDLPPMFGVIQQIEQLLVNLLMNAHEALGAQPGRTRGRVLVTTRRIENDQIELVVEDNGPGVAPVHRKHLFDPFFTTKEVGHGTGLGLSVSYGLAQEHGGEIHLDTSFEDGARFVVTLPSARAASRPPLVAVVDSYGVESSAVLLVGLPPDEACTLADVLGTASVYATVETEPERAMLRLQSATFDLIVVGADACVASGEPFVNELGRAFGRYADRVVVTDLGAGSGDSGTALDDLRSKVLERLKEALRGDGHVG